MEIPKTAIIVLGCIASVLFVILLLHLIYKLCKDWIPNRKRTKYQRLERKYRVKRTPSPSKTVSPKFSVSFPTVPFFLQLSDKEYDSSHSESDDVGKKRDSEAKLQQRRRKYGITNDGEIPMKKQWEERRKKRFFSESDIFTLTNRPETKPIDTKKRRAKSEQEVGVRPRRITSQSTLHVVSEISGQIEYTVITKSVNNELQVKVIQICDISEISPELFQDTFEIVDVEDLCASHDCPYLVRQKDGALKFSSPSELGLAVELMKFPRKEHIGTTDYKYGMSSQSFHETFHIRYKNIDQLLKTTLRFQVLLRYGQQPQLPVIIGETLLPLRDCRTDVMNSYREYLKFPANEKELESCVSDGTCIGYLTVSVRYQLLRQQLTVRIVEASYNSKFGVQQPSTSVKAGIYFCEFRVFKQATEVIKRTSNPQFNTSFDFDVTLERLAQTGILLEVKSHGTMQRNTAGYVHIGVNAESPGCDYWKEVLSFSDFNTQCILQIQNVKPIKVC